MEKNMDNSRKRKRSASDMAANNKLSRTSNSLSTDVKVEQTKHASKSIKSTQKINSSNLDVDLILDHKVFKNQMFYLVKRKNRSINYGEWEPAEKLMGYANVLYYQQVMMNSLEILNEEMISFFVNDLVTRQPQDILTITKLLGVIYGCTEEVIGSLRLTFADLKAKALKVPDIPVERLNKKRKSLRHVMRFSEDRKRVLNACAEWEEKINCVSPACVRVENDVDLEEPPANYRYINDYESSYVDLTPKPVVHCDCDDCFERRATCCAQSLGGSFAYDDQGRVLLPQGFEIYECNRLCKCGPDCPNRVVQRGPMIKLCIFRTSNGCGWGLKTLEEIKRGQFVLEYLGEVITQMDADVRDEAYDFTGATYLFDLGANGLFTVDAGLAGNASRFINHACDPNLQVYTVWGEQQDPGLPRLAFFSRRRVAKGEQLTFDYKMQGDADYLQAEGDRIKCKCGSKNCREYLF